MINILEIKNNIRKEIQNLNFFFNNLNTENKKIFLMIYPYLTNSIMYLDKNRIIKKKNKLEVLYGYINSLCKHDFIEDYIDIDPEFTKKIVYCRKCEYTLK